MPIDQFRMINTLNAAEDCLQALSTFQVQIEATLAIYKNAQISPHEALIQINELTRLPIHSRLRLSTIQTIERERAHFTPAKVRRNTRLRDKQARRRGRDPLSIPSNTWGGPPIDPSLVSSPLPPAQPPQPTEPTDDSEGIIPSNQNLFSSNPKED